MAMRDQRELALQCLDVETAGSSVIEYLKTQGFYSPRATWQRLQLNELGRTLHTLKDGKETKDMRAVVNDEQKKRAIQMALDGKSPLPYLRACGSAQPGKLWYSIKMRVKNKDVALFEKINKDFRSKEESDNAPTVKLYGPLNIETPEGNQIRRTEIPGSQVKDDDFETLTIRSKATGNRYEYSSEYKLFSIKAHGDEMALSPDDWKALLSELPTVAMKLGVKL